MVEKTFQTPEIHPHAIMGDFVNIYYDLIRPALEKRNVAGAVAVIGDVSMRFPEVEKNIVKCKQGTYAPYRMALTYLKGLSTEFSTKRHIDEGGLDFVLASINRQVEELDTIFSLQPDEIYEEYRQRE